MEELLSGHRLSVAIDVEGGKVEVEEVPSPRLPPKGIN